MKEYEGKIGAISIYNQPILDAFQYRLQIEGLAPKTVSLHMENIALFADYLACNEPFRRLDEADVGGALDFLTDQFPPDDPAISPRHIRSQMGTLRKFFKFMVQGKRMDALIEADLHKALRKYRNDFASGPPQ